MAHFISVSTNSSDIYPHGVIVMVMAYAHTYPTTEYPLSSYPPTILYGLRHRHAGTRFFSEAHHADCYWDVPNAYPDAYPIPYPDASLGDAPSPGFSGGSLYC